MKDASFNVQVRLDTAGQQVDGVEAYMTYPADKLEFISMSDSGSAFGLGFPSSGAGGNITIRRTVNPDVSPTVTGSNLLVMTLTFKTLVGSGTAAVNYTSASRVTAPSAGNGNVLAGTNGGTYTLTSPTSPAPPPPPPPPASSTSPKPPNTPAPKSPLSTSPNLAPGTTVPPISRDPVSQQASGPAVTPAADPNNTTPPVTVSSAETPKRSLILPLALKLLGGAFLLGSAAFLIHLALQLRHHLQPATSFVAPSGQQYFVGGSGNFQPPAGPVNPAGYAPPAQNPPQAPTGGPPDPGSVS